MHSTPDPGPRPGTILPVVLVVIALAVAVALSLLIRNHVAAADEPRDRPATSRTLTALLQEEHLDHLDLGTAAGHDEVSESGKDEVHLVMWDLSEASQLTVGVSRADEQGFPTSCRELEREGSILTCSLQDVDGVPVLWASTRENIIGDGLGPHGITWAAIRPGADELVVAAVTIEDTRGEPGAEDGTDLPVAAARLQEIAGDPQVGLRTTGTWVSAGEELGPREYRG